MTDITALRNALAELGVDPYEITTALLTGGPPTPPLVCESHGGVVDATVSTGIRDVCLPCATRITRHHEQQTQREAVHQ